MSEWTPTPETVLVVDRICTAARAENQGSALLFPSLCTPTGQLPSPTPERARGCTDRSLMMPRRSRTRAQNHAHYIATERRRNRERRQARQAAMTGGPAPSDTTNPDDDPPPF